MKFATLCYISRDGETLMLHRNRKQDDMHYGKYVALGGKSEPGESPEECVSREVEEESGLKLKKCRLKGSVTFSNEGRIFSDGKPREDWHVFVFVAEDFEGKQEECPDGDLKWVANSLLHTLPMWPGDRLILQWLEQPGIFSAKLTYKDDKLADHKVFFYQ